MQYQNAQVYNSTPPSRSPSSNSSPMMSILDHISSMLSQLLVSALSPQSSSPGYTMPPLSSHSQSISPLLRLLMLPVICVCVSAMLRYDGICKKIGFGFSLWIIWTIFASRTNHDQQNSMTNSNGCAKTAYLLLTVVAIQIKLIGATMMVMKKTTTNTALNHRYVLTVVLAELVTTSGIGLVCALWTGYYKQLLHMEIFEMGAYVGIGFGAVAVADYFYLSIKTKIEYNRGRGSCEQPKSVSKEPSALNKQDSARRKVFHFIPAGLLPVLSRIHFQLFTLMAFGAFYLFWLVELLRYFGKLARTQSINNNNNINNINSNNISDDSRQSGQQKQTCTQTNQTNQTRGCYFGILVRVVNKYNDKLSGNSIIAWMQSLNSSRQPYFWFTHLSLILGLTLSYIYFANNNSTPHSGYFNTGHQLVSTTVKQGMHMDISVVLVLADAAAAIIGKAYGRLRIPFTGNKTVQGYCAFVSTMIVAQFAMAMAPLMMSSQDTYAIGTDTNASMPYSLSGAISEAYGHIDMGWTLGSAVLCGVGELFAGDLDNIITGIIYILAHRGWNWYCSVA